MPLKKPKIAIIGAGLAGMTAAYRLFQKGFDVDVFEAKNRVGGRVFSVYINDRIGELGGQNIADGKGAKNIYRLIDEFGLKTVEHTMKMDLYCDNKGSLQSLNHLLQEKNFHPEELRKKLDQLMVKSRNIEEVLKGIFLTGDPLCKSLAVRLAAYEGGPIDQLSPVYTETLFHMLLGGVCDAHQGNQEVSFVSIQGGNSLLLTKIQEKLGERVLLKMPLKALLRHNGTYELIFPEKTLKADIVLLAIPCTVYQDINFSSIIPQKQLQSIQQLHYGTNAKILYPMLPSAEKKVIVTNESISFPDSKAQLLSLYFAGKSSFFDKNTMDHDFSLFKKNYPLTSSTPTYAEDCLFSSYKTPVGYSWPNDPHIRGSYSYIAAGQEKLLAEITDNGDCSYRTLFSSIENSLFFAGEHASILTDIPGTMEAACESGERAARMIESALLHH